MKKLLCTVAVILLFALCLASCNMTPDISLPSDTQEATSPSGTSQASGTSVTDVPADTSVLDSTDNSDTYKPNITDTPGATDNPNITGTTRPTDTPEASESQTPSESTPSQSETLAPTNPSDDTDNTGKPSDTKKPSDSSNEPSNSDEPAVPSDEPDSSDEPAAPSDEPDSSDEPAAPSDEPDSSDEPAAPSDEPDSSESGDNTEKPDDSNTSSSYKVLFYTYGGRLDGLTLNSTSTLKSQLSISYYSTGYFSVYQTEVVLMKTSLMSSGDSYQYALKVGFNATSENNYTVTQIVEPGTSLTTDKRSSEYYLLVSSENASGYATVSSISIGDTLQIDKSLPSEISSNLGANLKCYVPGNGADTYYEAEYSSAVTLPTPVHQYHTFKGWYTKADLSGAAVTTVSAGTTVYAKWELSDLTPLLAYVSNTATQNTRDNLPSEYAGMTLEWSSSNPELYMIANGIGSVAKVKQTHKVQSVTVTLKATYHDSRVISKSKQIAVSPITFKQLTSTPVATYFQSSAFYAYKQYNDRYKQDGTVFSDTTKQTLDIIYWSFARLDAQGNVTLDNTSIIPELIALRAHDVRVVLCVAGVDAEESLAFQTVCSNDTLRAKFITNLMNIVEQYNFDGVDIDWESVTGAPVVAASMTALMKDLRAEMTARQAAGGTPYHLSAAVPANSWGTAEDRFNFVELDKYLDYINLMSYDMNNPEKASHLSPLYKSENDNAYGFGCVYGVNRLVEKGFSKNKIIIGSAGYGKAYSVSGTSANAAYPALGATASLIQISGVEGSFATGTLFGNAIQTLISSGKYTQYIEKDSSGNIVASYLYNSTDKIFVTYDSPEIIKAKYEYAKSQGLGIMCWCYTEDTTDSIINAIYQAKNSQ